MIAIISLKKKKKILFLPAEIKVSIIIYHLLLYIIMMSFGTCTSKRYLKRITKCLLDNASSELIMLLAVSFLHATKNPIFESCRCIVNEQHVKLYYYNI